MLFEIIKRIYLIDIFAVIKSQLNFLVEINKYINNKTQLIFAFNQTPYLYLFKINKLLSSLVKLTNNIT